MNDSEKIRTGRDRMFFHGSCRLVRRLTGLVVTVVAAAVCDHAGRAGELETEIDVSVRRALTWLAAEQKPSGAWRADDYGESTAATSLAVLAFLTGGHVPDEGPWGEQISRGVGWILQQQNENGLLTGRDTSHGPMYSHGITTLMLAEVSGMVSEAQAEPCRMALERAVRLIIDRHNEQRSNRLFICRCGDCSQSLLSNYRRHLAIDEQDAARLWR